MVMIFNILILLSMFFFVIQDFFKSEEILSSLLIELLLNVSINRNKFWNNDMF